MPKVSVIVPVYNTEKYLPRCIDSILAQTFIDFELILIDDGSIDASGEICDEYAKKDSRIVVIHKENGGASAARNKGIEIAQGEWISFVDSDDYLKNTFLSAFPMDRENHIEICGVLSFNGQSFSSFQKKTTYSGGNIVEFYESLFKYRANTSVYAKIIKRNIIHENNIYFDTNITLTEDTLFILKTLRYINIIHVIPQTNYYYNSPNNIIAKYNITPEQIKYNLVKLISCAAKLTHKYDFNLSTITEPIKCFQFACFKHLLINSDRKKKINYLIRYRKLDLFKYRPKMSIMKSIYLWLETNFPYIMVFI